jgi:hypothetical protein
MWPARQAARPASGWPSSKRQSATNHPASGKAAASSRVEMRGVRNLFSARRILPAMDARHAMLRERDDDRREPRGRLPLPPVTRAEREFWRRAVEAERRRQRCGRPAPFPFQPA